MKKFILTCCLILVLSLVAGFYAKNLYPDAGITASNVDTVQTEMLLFPIENAQMAEDAEHVIAEGRAWATESGRRFSVIKVAVHGIAFCSQNKIMYDCDVLKTLEGDEISSGTRIQIHQDPFKGINYQFDENMKSFRSYLESEECDPALREKLKGINVFYNSYKSPLKAGHTYLLFVSSFEVYNDTFYIMMDSFDYAETVNKPVIEGPPARYSDYLDNEVYCQEQETIDRYNEIKQELFSMYS